MIISLWKNKENTFEKQEKSAQPCVDNMHKKGKYNCQFITNGIFCLVVQNILANYRPDFTEHI